jgi:hypothetical protein
VVEVVFATVDHSDIRGSKPHNHLPRTVTTARDVECILTCGSRQEPKRLFVIDLNVDPIQVAGS